MIRPRKMKRIELTVLRRDVDSVLEYLGMKAVLQLSRSEGENAGPKNGASANERAGDSATGIGAAKEATPSAVLERLRAAAAYLGVALPEEPGISSRLPAAEDASAAFTAADGAERLRGREIGLDAEKRKLEGTLEEAKSFTKLDAPFSDLDKLSYLTLRLGRLDPRRVGDVVQSLGDRAVIIPLGEDGRVLAAASRKGRFALDSELEKASFSSIAVPEGFTGVPRELLSGLEKRLSEIEGEFAALSVEKEAYARASSAEMVRLSQSYQIAVEVQRLKASLVSTKSAYRLGGWIAADRVPSTVSDLEHLAAGRVAVVAFEPDEVVSVREGEEKVPVSLDHGRFVGGFEPMVFSYGAPLYGTIDPTPFVAFFFTLLFGLMFGDVGQGFVFLALGFLVDRGRFKLLSGFARFSPALTAVGLSSMTIGFLDGEVFASDSLLVAPTRAVTGFLTGVPVDRVLHFMPEKGSMDKLFLFFAFTLAVGVVINSIGLVINILNQASLKKWDKVFFAKTGLAGALFFWYALFMAVRVASGGSFAWFDAVGLVLPLLALFFGPLLWRLISGSRPILEHGFVAFLFEGAVELLESVSYYVSNTVSFLRVGAFALSHAVLSFIVFAMSDLVGRVPAGFVFSAVVVVVGNLIIIFLEGLIVAIQVVRLQYYEFFSKFFTETGVKFAPFRFRREVK